jgi:hypothetical protein
MCVGPDTSDASNTIERQSEVDTFTNTRNVGSVSDAGHSGLSTGEAADIALNPASKMASSREKGLAAAQLAAPGGLILGGLRSFGLRSHGGLLGSGSGKTLLGG